MALEYSNLYRAGRGVLSRHAVSAIRSSFDARFRKGRCGKCSTQGSERGRRKQKAIADPRVTDITGLNLKHDVIKHVDHRRRRGARGLAIQSEGCARSPLRVQHHR